MRAIQEALTAQLLAIADSMEQIVSNTFVDTMTEERISQWERWLAIIPEGNVEQRRLYLKSVLRGSGKLNESRIQTIVNALTGGAAVVSFADGVVTVQVLPPGNGEIYLFTDVERALLPKIPAHLGLKVIRFYSTWQDIADSFDSWGDIANNFGTWKEVYNYTGLEEEI